LLNSLAVRSAEFTQAARDLPVNVALQAGINAEIALQQQQHLSTFTTAPRM
jgi:hypothetical protein